MEESHQIELDEPVELRAYDRIWSETYRYESNRLNLKLRGHVVAVEHIGSTAVPGLRSKPIVDIMVGVRAVGLRIEVIAPLLDEYESLGLAGVPGRLYFRKRGKHAVNVHVVEYLGKHWQDNILIREYLRAHPKEADRYGQFKDRILAEGSCTLIAYSRAKQAIMDQLLSDAGEWRDLSGPEAGIDT